MSLDAWEHGFEDSSGFRGVAEFPLFLSDGGRMPQQQAKKAYLGRQAFGLFVCSLGFRDPIEPAHIWMPEDKTVSVVQRISEQDPVQHSLLETIFRHQL